MINVFKLMNNRSIYNVLWTRNIDSAIFNVIIVVYGLYLNCYYKKSDKPNKTQDKAMEKFEEFLKYYKKEKNPFERR